MIYFYIAITIFICFYSYSKSIFNRWIEISLVLLSFSSFFSVFVYGVMLKTVDSNIAIFLGISSILLAFVPNQILTLLLRKYFLFETGSDLDIINRKRVYFESISTIVYCNILTYIVFYTEIIDVYIITPIVLIPTYIVFILQLFLLRYIKKQWFEIIEDKKEKL